MPSYLDGSSRTYTPTAGPSAYEVGPARQLDWSPLVSVMLQQRAWQRQLEQDQRQKEIDANQLAAQEMERQWTARQAIANEAMIPIPGEHPTETVPVPALAPSEEDLGGGTTIAFGQGTDQAPTPNPTVELPGVSFRGKEYIPPSTRTREYQADIDQRAADLAEAKAEASLKGKTEKPQTVMTQELYDHLKKVAPVYADLWGGVGYPFDVEIINKVLGIGAKDGKQSKSIIATAGPNKGKEIDEYDPYYQESLEDMQARIKGKYTKEKPSVEAADFNQLVDMYVKADITTADLGRLDGVTKAKLVAEAGRRTGGKFTSQTYAQRRKTRDDFAGSSPSTSGGQIDSLNQLAGHLQLLGEAADAMDNFSVPRVSRFVNNVKTALGSESVTNFETAKLAVASETSRLLKGGVAGEKEADKWEQRISSSNSPAQLNGAIRELRDLIRSRLRAKRQKWNSKMGKENEAEFDTMLLPEALELFGEEGATESTGASAPSFSDRSVMTHGGTGAAAAPRTGSATPWFAGTQNPSPGAMGSFLSGLNNQATPPPTQPGKKIKRMVIGG